MVYSEILLRKDVRVFIPTYHLLQYLLWFSVLSKSKCLGNIRTTDDEIPSLGNTKNLLATVYAFREYIVKYFVLK